MTPALFKIRNYLHLPLIFIFSFIIISLFYIDRSAKEDKKLFTKHAVTISDNIWAMDKTGVEVYLQLALETDTFRNLHVSIPGEDSFLQINAPPLTGLSHLLFNFNLIGMKHHSEPIFHENLIIGNLSGDKYVRIIFPLANILIFMLFALLLFAFMSYQATSKKYLAEQVQERTVNLLQSERRFHDLVNLLPEMVLETDLEGEILYANKGAQEHLGLTLHQNKNQCFFDIITESDREEAEQEFKNSLTGKPSGLLEFRATDVNNCLFPVLIHFSAIFKADQVTGARMVAIDVSQRRKMEEQLHRDQKMKAIGLMAGGVAHDLNNILSGIISYPEFLLLDLDKNNHMRPPLEAIRQSGLDAAEVVSDLLTVARGVATNTEVVDLNDIIANYLSTPDFRDLADKNREITISSTLSETLPYVHCSPIHIRKCLMNLILNGLEAIDGKGSISINSRTYDSSNNTTETSDTKVITFNQRPKAGHYSMIVVSDSGAGISTEEIDHIFEPFYTKKVMGRSGTGLGLAVVWNTILDHNGAIHVISSKEGTTFELFFPIATKAIPKAQKKTDWRTLMGQGETILAVDDEERQRDIAEKLLTSLGYIVVTASSGEEAVDYMQNNNVDLVVLDMIMPPGQNGRDTYEQILQFHPEQKAIIASGFAEDDVVRETLDMGANLFVAKPYTLEQLGSAIHTTLQS